MHRVANRHGIAHSASRARGWICLTVARAVVGGLGDDGERRNTEVCLDETANKRVVGCLEHCVSILIVVRIEPVDFHQRRIKCSRQVNLKREDGWTGLWSTSSVVVQGSNGGIRSWQRSGVAVKCAQESQDWKRISCGTKIDNLHLSHAAN